MVEIFARSSWGVMTAAPHSVQIAGLAVFLILAVFLRPWRSVSELAA